MAWLLKAEVSMCIVSERVIALSLPFEISIYIPIPPHHHYNLLCHPRSSSLLTFPLFPLLSLAISPHYLCPPVFFISPFACLFSLLSSSTFLTGLSQSLLCLSIVALLLCSLSSFQMQPDCLGPIILCSWLAQPCVFQIPTFAGDVRRTVGSATPPISAQNVNLEWGKLKVLLNNT